MFNTPILFLIFNRPDTTIKVFEQIAKVKPSKLYVAADGPRFDRPDEAILCADARAVVANKVDWNCEVKYLYREENLGCKLAVSEAINWFFDQEELGIILEDDCLPDLSFFYYCQELLHRYEHDDEVLSINGCNYGFKHEGASYFFSRYMNFWGWATWRRAAQQVNYSIPEWGDLDQMNFLKSRLKSGITDLDTDWFKHWKIIFDRVSTDELDTWDYFWLYHQFKYKKKNILPSINLIKNIGFSNKATHTTLLNHPAAFLTEESLTFPLKHKAKRNNFNLKYENEALKPICYMYERKQNSYYIKRWLVRLPLIHLLYKFKNSNKE